MQDVRHQFLRAATHLPEHLIQPGRLRPDGNHLAKTVFQQAKTLIEHAHAGTPGRHLDGVLHEVAAQHPCLLPGLPHCLRREIRARARATELHRQRMQLTAFLPRSHNL